MPRRVDLPLSPELTRELRAGDELLLCGPAFAARDATCLRLLDEARACGGAPFGLAGQLLCFIGPTPAAAGRPHGAAGPTTARRMDRATLELARFGLTATFGKGERSAELRAACREQGCVYLVGIGGAAALAALHITASEVVAWPELGPEALRRLTLADFPAFVAYDTHGGDIYQQEGDRGRVFRAVGLAGDSPPGYPQAKGATPVAPRGDSDA
ncbi:MAG: fumarate hydratase C-terminal domain-containing protein [Actinomycetia bacterium]|nr:fumarate hydratase C-terminal domain-containing protein [Actinomycetes bacterium]